MIILYSAAIQNLLYLPHPFKKYILKIYHSLDEFPGITRPVLTIGTFDGVHIGHKVIIDQIKEIAQNIGGETVLLTFNPHPRLVLFPDDQDLKLLNTQEEKEAHLEAAGIDHLIVHPFSREFGNMPALEYVRQVLVSQIGVKKMAVGYDHHFGRHREGNFELLAEFGETYGFDVIEIPAQHIEQVNVSSTKIRQALLDGDVATANSYLGYRYALSGKVVKGEQLGQTLGYPTANLHINDPLKLIPALGAYAVYAFVEGVVYPAMMNIGKRPTINELETVSIEVHLIGFEGDLYGKSLRVELVEYIRAEQRFGHLDELKLQLEKDRQKTLIALS